MVEFNEKINNREIRLTGVDKIIDYLDQLEFATKEFFCKKSSEKSSEKSNEINNINSINGTGVTSATDKTSYDNWTGKGLANPNFYYDILKQKRNSPQCII